MDACQILAISKKLGIPRITLWYLCLKTWLNSSDIDAWYSRTHILMNAYSEFEQARAVYEQALEANPSSAFLWLRKAELLAYRFNREDAEAAYNRALELDPDDVQIYLSMARMYGLSEGSASNGTLTPARQKALELCDNALALEPDNTEVLRFKSIVLLGAGKSEESRAATSQALEIDPGNRDALLDEAMDLIHDGRDEEALRVYEKYLDLYPDSMGIWCVKGDCLSRLGRYEEALAAHEKAISFDPEATTWDISPYLEGKADALAKLRRFDEAYAAYDRIMKIDPYRYYSKIAVKKADVLVLQEHPDEAIKTLETALKDLGRYRTEMSPETYKRIREEIGKAKESVARHKAVGQGKGEKNG